MPIQHTFRQLSCIILLTIIFSQGMAQDCDSATDSLFRAYALATQHKLVPQQKLLLTKSLRLCPANPDAHTTLADIFAQQGRHSEAINSYKRALRYDKNFHKAWHGLGEVYYQQKRIPLSLEAHLHACQHNETSKARAMALLNEKSYTFTKSENILDDQEGLQVLYDKQRQQKLNQMVADCGLSEVATPQDCNLANDLIFRAYSLPEQEVNSKQKHFIKSLQLCPERPDIHSKLASLLLKQGQSSEAVHYYKQALNYDKEHYKAWYGLGKAYFKQKRFPLSLEAHLQACQHEVGSKIQVQNLLAKQLYAFTKENEIIDEESLLVLFDNKRRQSLNKSISDCGLVGEVRSLHTFLNFVFQLGKTSIPARSVQQLDEIAAALQKADFSIVTVHGHTDGRRFQVGSRIESDKKNLRLSQARAVKIGTALIQQGITKERIKMLGHSYKKPLLSDWSISSKNRRIEIEVK